MLVNWEIRRSNVSLAFEIDNGKIWNGSVRKRTWEQLGKEMDQIRSKSSYQSYLVQQWAWRICPEKQCLTMEPSWIWWSNQVKSMYCIIDEVCASKLSKVMVSWSYHKEEYIHRSVLCGSSPGTCASVSRKSRFRCSMDTVVSLRFCTCSMTLVTS